ncbi:hypothetical protein F4821DRAFT_244002 [Hypoxylon rubiginosum]|uniref:Uncharacterized protein n=1 Tax=Hypoxylon rubiginosum TaxID=110542 RepID=A0ACC0CTR8_9PEZI|nr:hypothetical protein F4821DRAFT_244002 [Hypoxylon rubiginosum]
MVKVKAAPPRSRCAKMQPRDLGDQNNAPDPSWRFGRRALSFKRQNTTDSAQSTASSRRSQSFNITARKERKEAKQKRIQESYPVYNGLKWDALREYLHQKWPDEDFKEVKRNDYWVFETPERLTNEDHTALNALRDKNTRGQRDVVTPEP